VKNKPFSKKQHSRSFAECNTKGGQFNSVDYDHNVSIQPYFPIGKITKNQSPTSGISEHLSRKALTE
jgi:hypothetical protein